MDLKDMILIALGVTTIVLAIISIFVSFINSSKKNRYDYVHKQVHLDEMRNYYESKIYELNKKNSSDPIRWKETNHLVLNGNETSLNSENLKSNITVGSNFLKNHGLSHDDLKIDKKSVFVLTSFIESEMPTYKEIKSICDDVGLNCSRSDEEYINGDILPHILRKISKARLVIANLDGRNPNVYYELGIAHALDKPTILISNFVNDIPFDLKSKNIIIYKTFTELRQKLATELTKTIINNE
ncbi:hypothetical protein [Bacillus infantis]|uniref:hypothetical protein n=1 Tax=Bacillus infantis TaxID=324767 RepID=UPI003CED4C7A